MRHLLASRLVAKHSPHPANVAARGGKLPTGFSTGTLDMFEREGFEVIASLPSARTLVHLDLAA